MRRENKQEYETSGQASWEIQNCQQVTPSYKSYLQRGEGLAIYIS